jgi:hypothetical protein
MQRAWRRSPNRKASAGPRKARGLQIMRSKASVPTKARLLQFHVETKPELPELPTLLTSDEIDRTLHAAAMLAMDMRKARP